jgi:outer membrane usher protein
VQRRSAINELLALVVAAGLAASARPLHAQAKQEIPFPLTFNEVAKGEIAVVIAGSDVFVLAEDLERAGVTGTMWERLLRFARLREASHIESGGRQFIALRSFAPLLTYVLDEENLALSVTAMPELLTPSTFNVESGPPAGIIYTRDASTFLNYAVTSAGSDQTSLFLETGSSVAGNLLYNSAARNEDGSIVRFTTSYTVDDRKRLNRWVYGDANVVSDALGGAPLMGGVTASKNFNLDPYFVRYPPLNFRGTALTPSRVEIYMNGSLVALQDIPPGPFELRNIPASAGAGTERVVIRDVFGREQVSGAAYYYSTDVLARGISEYIYSAGFQREGFGLRSFDYGDPAVIGYHRIGITDDLTVGGRLEATRSLISGGPRVTKRTAIGDFGLAGAFSRDRGDSGAAGEVAYRYLARKFSFGGSAQFQSRQYANLTQRKELDRSLFNVHTFASYLLKLASLSLIWDRSDLRDLNDVDRIMLLTSVPVSRRASFFASVGSANEGNGRKAEVFAGVSFFVGATTTANVAMSRRAGRTETTFDVQKSLGVGTGFGYRVHANRSPGANSGSAALQYQTNFGRYELTFNPTDISERPTFTATGGLVYQKGSFLTARAVAESFALVRIPGVRNVRVYSSNMTVGRTDHNGDLLVPNLLSYYGNRLRIEDKDIPLNYEVSATERTVAPPYRGGAFVQFPVRQIRTITGNLVIRRNGENVVPAYGQLTATAGTESFVSPLGRAGEFYLENAPSGTHPSMIEYKDGTCSFELVIPPGTDPVLKMGTVACTEGPKP